MLDDRSRGYRRDFVVALAQVVDNYRTAEAALSGVTRIPRRRCAWCQRELPLGMRADAQCCSARCRAALWSWRQSEEAVRDAS